MDGFGHLDLGRCRPSQNGGGDRADQDLSGTKRTSPVGLSAVASPHPLTLRALFTLVPSECGPAARSRAEITEPAVGRAKQTAKSLSPTSLKAI